MEKAYELNNEEVANTDIDTVTGDMFEGLGFFDDEKKEEKKPETEETIQINKKTTNKPKDKDVESKKEKKTNKKVVEPKEVIREVIKEKVEELSEEQKAEEEAKEQRKILHSMIAEELKAWPNVYFEQLDVDPNGIITALVGVEEKYIAMGGKFNGGKLHLKLAIAKCANLDHKDSKEKFLENVDRVVTLDFDRWERTKEQFEELRKTNEYKKEEDSFVYRVIYGKLNREDIVKVQEKYAEKRQLKNNQQKQAS